jgi:hypothetical protein
MKFVRKCLFHDVSYDQNIGPAVSGITDHILCINPSHYFLLLMYSLLSQWYEKHPHTKKPYSNVMNKIICTLLWHLNLSLVENYAKKNCNQNKLQLFWPTSYAVAKQLQICVFFGLMIEILRTLGACIYRWKGLENAFPTVITHPQISKIIKCIS